MPLQPQPVPVHLLGLDGKVASKYAQAGKLDLLENGYATRRAAEDGGGIVVEKRLGTTSLPKALDSFSGAAITTGRKLAALGDELLMSDGTSLFSWDPGRNQWNGRGLVPTVAALRDQLDGIPVIGVGTQNVKTAGDAAYANGWAVFIASTADGTVGGGLGYYMVDLATGVVVIRNTITAYRARVVAVGTTFFLFAYDTVGGITCYTATPGVAFGSVATVVAAASMGSHFFDVAVDSTNARMIVAYRNTTPGLTLMLWNTNQTAGISVNYNTRDPLNCIGFFDHSWGDGNGYVGIGGTVAGIRALTFSATTLVVGTDTLITGTPTSRNITGWRLGTHTVAIYEIAGATSDLNRIDAADIPGSVTISNVRRGCGLAGRVFKQGGAYFFPVALESTTQRNLYLFRMQPGGSLDKIVTIAGFLMNGDAGGLNADGSHLGGPAIVAADRMLLPCMGLLGPGTGISGARHYTVEYFDLRFNEDLMSAAVPFNGVLHIPGACPRVYDGDQVFEDGFVTLPETPTGIAGAGGALTAGTYKYLLVFSRIDHAGNLVRGTAGPLGTVITGAANGVGLTIPTLRMVTFDTFRRVPNERIEIYRTKVNGSTFFLNSVISNDYTVDTIAVSDTLADSALGEVLYSSDKVDNATPPAVLAYASHRNRLIALSSGDNAIWPSKETTEGDAVGFMAEGRVLFDASDGGRPTGIVPLDSTLVVAKRSRLYAITGEGPDLDGSNPYPYPAPLPGNVGMLSARSFMMTPAGALIKSAKGMFLLDRGGTQTPVEGSNTYDALTVTGGVSLDDRPFSCMVTAEGTTIVRDWQLGQWYAWTGQAAVACCLWQNKLVLLAADGTVRVETAGTWADDGVAFTWKVRLAWLHLSQIMGFERIWEIQVLADFLSTTTFIARLAYDNNATPTQSPQAAVTAASPSQLSIKPAKQECVALQPTFEETSTGQGVALMGLLIEAGFEPRGLRPLAASQGMT